MSNPWVRGTWRGFSGKEELPEKTQALGLSGLSGTGGGKKGSVEEKPERENKSEETQGETGGQVQCEA